ncbi:MAG: Tad domain-containing protein [Candidatus Eisenbacteria bacterium]
MKRRNRGQVLVLVALAIFVLLGFAALGIDVGFMYSVRHELQRSADAGALAGASAFTTGDWNNSSVRSIADSRAREFASKYKVVQTALNPASEVAVSFPLLDRIEVVTSRTADLFFARIFGMSNRLITARAVAQAAVVGSEVPVNCIKPFAIPYPWLDDPAYGLNRDGTGPDGEYDGSPAPGETIYKDCNGGVGLCPGTSITLKVGSPSADNTSPSGQQSSGHFFLMQGNVGGETFQGAAELRNYISSGCFPIDMTLPVDLMTGNAMGPVVQGIQALIDNATLGGYSTTFPSDLSTNAFELSSPRVVRVVMYDPSVPIVGGGAGGTQGTGASVQVGYDLAGFWIESVGRQGPDGFVTGRYIPASAFGSPTGTPGPLTGTEVKVIALVE